MKPVTYRPIAIATLVFTFLAGCGRLGYDAQEGTIGPNGSDAGSDAGGDVERLGGDLLSGWYHTCLIRADQISCWGDNSDGQFGDGAYDIVNTPRVLTNLPGPPVVVTAGNEHMCMLADGNAYCWGHSKAGELGTGDNNSRESPTQVIGLPDGSVTDIEAGGGSTCAISNGSVYCWGANYNGQLGDGTYQDSHTPRLVIGIVGAAVSVNTGADHACAITTEGAVYCWGHNDNGALGMGNFEEDSNVARASLMTDADQVSIASMHACALADGAMYCWGTGDKGELGDGNYEHSHTPVPVLGLGDSVTAMFTASGNNSNDATCAIQNGSVFCWGNNNRGRLGDGTTDDRGEPTEVWLPASAIDVAGGAAHSCALLSDDSVWCWGRGNLGQLGDGQEQNSLAPVQVAL